MKSSSLASLEHFVLKVHEARFILLLVSIPHNSSRFPCWNYGGSFRFDS